MLETIVIQPDKAPQLAVIWLHGLGADGHDFEGVVPFLNVPSHCQVRYIFPHAPHRSVTINMGMRMRAWYDIINPILGEPPEDREGVVESCDLVADIIAQEKANGIGPERIVLAGFSQGGAVALHLGLQYPERLAGIMALSTYLPLVDTVENQMSKANRQTPILYLHGSADPVIPITTAQRSRQVLLELGCNVKSKDYLMPHAVSPDEMMDIGVWLKERCESTMHDADVDGT